MHTSQPVWPLRGWYVPGGQRTHVACFSSGLYVPGAHSASSSAPTEQYVPLLHTMQSASLVITASELLWRVPAGHGRGAAAPTAQ